MSSRVKILAVLGFVILLILAGLYCLQIVTEPAEPAPPPEKPVETKAIKAIVDEVHNLASNGIPASLIFAKKLTNVLSAHNVSLPDKLARLVAPKPPVPDPNNDEVLRIYESGHKIYSVCEGSTWIKDPNYAVPVSLRNELLATVANHCPSSILRVEAAYCLAERALPPTSDNEITIPDVPKRLAAKACASAINHILSRTSEGKAGSDLTGALLWMGRNQLVIYHLMLEAMAAKQPAKETLDKILAEFASKTNAALEAASDEKHITALNGLKEYLKAAEKYADGFAQWASWKIELEPVIKAFLDAVNKEDEQAAKKYLTEKTAANLTENDSKNRSLRERLWYRDTDEIIYQDMSLFGGEVGAGMDVPVFVIVIDTRGTKQHRVIEFSVVKTPKGWLIGDE